MDVASRWTIRAIVVPKSKPIVVKRDWEVGHGETGTGAFLAFDVQAVSGLEPGKVYHCLAPLSSSARPSEATRFVLMGWRSAASRLPIETQDELQTRLGRLVRTVEGGEDTLYATVMVPTRATKTGSGKWAFYDDLTAALPDASPTTVRQVTRVFSAIPDVTVGTPKDQADVCIEIQQRLAKALSALPQRNPLEEFRYGGLLAQWNRPDRALAFLKALPELQRAISLDRSDPMQIRRSGDAQDDADFLGHLDLIEGLDADAVFEAVWNTELQDYALSSQLSRAPSIENQRRAFSLLGGSDTDRRAQIFACLAGWNSDWPRLAQSVARWSDEAEGMVIENETALRDYWERKFAGPPKP